MDNTIQMNLFEYFLDEEKFSIQDATNLVKNVKNMQVNNESIRARIYEGVEKGIFTKIAPKPIGNNKVGSSFLAIAK